MKRASIVIANFEREMKRALKPRGVCTTCISNGKSIGWMGVVFVTPSGASSKVIGGCPACGRVCGVKAYGAEDDRDGEDRRDGLRVQVGMDDNASVQPQTTRTGGKRATTKKSTMRIPAWWLCV